MSAITRDASVEMTFFENKIDYNQHLGSGAFGNVYSLVKRPEDEKGYCSYLFPYVYDYIFRVDKESREETGFCVKILDYLIVNGINKLHPFILYMEPASQFSANRLLRERNISKIEYCSSGGILSYFKTRIQGKTLEDYIVFNDFLCKEEDFELRKNFVKFLRSIDNIDLFIEDPHAGNIMYDEVEGRWELVDGFVEKSICKISLKNQMWKILIKKYYIASSVINSLADIAQSSTDYNRDIDQEVIAKALKDIKPEEFNEQKAVSKNNLYQDRIEEVWGNRFQAFVAFIKVIIVGSLFFAFLSNSRGVT